MRALTINDFLTVENEREQIYLSNFHWDTKWKERKNKKIKAIHNNINYIPKYTQYYLYKIGND